MCWSCSVVATWGGLDFGRAEDKSGFAWLVWLWAGRGCAQQGRRSWQCQSVGCSPLVQHWFWGCSAPGKVWQHVLASLQGWRYPGLGAGLCTILMTEWREVDEENCCGVQAHPHLLLSTPPVWRGGQRAEQTCRALLGD